MRKVAGQLNAIERMLAEDRDCTDILTQIVSARRGLKSLGEKLIHSHMHHCIEAADSPAWLPLSGLAIVILMVLYVMIRAAMQPPAPEVDAAPAADSEAVAPAPAAE